MEGGRCSGRARVWVAALVACSAQPALPDGPVPTVAPCARFTAEPASPEETGRRELDAELVAIGSALCAAVTTADSDAGRAALARARVPLDPRAESFVVVTDGAKAVVVGRDPPGAMYGAFELAERLRLDG